MIARSDQAEDSQIVGFGAATGEDDFGWLATQQRGDRLARALDCRTRFLSVMVPLPKLRRCAIGSRRPFQDLSKESQ